MAETNLLIPDFEKAHWRHVEHARYRDQAGFSKKKKHFEPEDHNSFAMRWAAELTQEDRLAEIRQIYENAMVILGNKRSQMERGEESLDCAQFRFTIHSDQDPVDPKLIRTVRAWTVKIPLHSLPPHFDELFPYKPNELVVPFAGGISPRDILENFEDWEIKTKGRISESADQSVIKLQLPNGFSLSADLQAREAIFAKTLTEGIGSLSQAVQGDLRSLGIVKRLE